MIQNDNKKDIKRGAPRERRPRDGAPKDAFESKNIAIRRVTKVVKGGRTMRFSAAVVVGDKNGSVGVGLGKAAEVPNAMEKANASARKNIIKVAMVDTTIPHAVEGVFGRGRVLLMPAPLGTGVIAGGPVRAVLEAAGIKDIRTKSLGCNNPINCAKAAIEGLKLLRTKEQIEAARFSTKEETKVEG